MITKIKNLGPYKVYKKNCLLLKIYNDKNKNFILTQLLIIEQVSQYLIVFSITIFLNNKISIFFLQIIIHIYNFEILLKIHI